MFDRILDARQEASGPSLRHRRLAAGAVVSLLVVDLWVIAGKPWWPPMALVAGAVLVSLLRRVLPRGVTYPLVAVGVVAVLVVAPQLTTAVLLLTAGGALALVRFRADRGVLGATRNRAWLAVAVVLVLTSFAGLAVEQVRADRRRAAEQEQASAVNRAALLPPSPERVARRLLEVVADDDPIACTLEFGPAAAAQIATATRVSDCPAAIHALADRVVDPLRYQRPDYDAVTVTWSRDRQTSTIDACHLSWDGLSRVLDGTTADSRQQPGPQLGRLDLARILGRGYQIIDFNSC